VFEEAQLYAPITTADDGAVTVHLDEDHPGFGDPDYRARRNVIAARALTWKPSEPVPHVDYTEEEQDVWREVCRELAAKHERLACAEYREATARLALPADHIPQLDEVGERLRPLTGFEYHPAAGLVGFEEFYGSLADGIFHSTQYIRHHARPLYTPEPDLIHEVIGHGGMLASPRLAELNRLAGRAARRLETKAGRDFFSTVFWFSIEFGVLYENGELRAYGAGLLSSYGEIPRRRYPAARDRRHGLARLRHHQVPAGPVRRRRHGAAARRRRRVLRRVRRRLAGAAGRARADARLTGHVAAPVAPARRRRVRAVSSLRALDHRMLRLARTRGHGPRRERAVVAYSRLGEHAACWLALGLAGAALHPGRRRPWLRGVGVVAGSYVLNYAVKVLVRRPRPQLEGLPALSPVVSALSFPSAHATTSFAAARAYRGLVPAAPLYVAAGAFAFTRPYLGVHYPSDVLAGAALGTAVGRAAAGGVSRCR
jgi:phenylalanine-4-hydroxylase